MTNIIKLKRRYKNGNIGFALLSICLTLFQFEIHLVNGLICGTVKVPRPLMLGGSKTFRGEWPFLAALYNVDTSEIFCGGTLISSKHVITAAHCVQGKFSQDKLAVHDLKVRIGAYDLTTNETGVEERNIREIMVHPDWDVYDDKYDADIAILVLNESVPFTNYIQPACLPADDAVIDSARASIVGWGLAENAENTTLLHKEFPILVVTRVLNDSYCYTKDNGIAMFSSERTFCGGDGNGVPNRGDSGGGVFILSGFSWVQHGIISAIRSNGAGVVVDNSFAIYTNVKFFKNWIVDIVTKSGDEVGEANGITLSCVYMYFDCSKLNLCYGCLIYDFDVQNEKLRMAAFTGSHLPGKTDQDVELISFYNGTMFYLPGAIGNFFHNLKLLVVKDEAGLKLLKRSNFKKLENLVRIKVSENKIDFLEENALFDLPYLEEFDIANNNLKIIPETIFEQNTKLRTIDFNFNDLQHLPRNLLKNNLLLESVDFGFNWLTTIDVDFKQLKNIKQLNFNGNICIEARFDVQEEPRIYQTLADFQKVIRTNCSSTNP